MRMRQKARKGASPPEHAGIPRRAGSRSGARQPKKNRRSASATDFEANLSRRARVREQRYEAKRRRQWILAISIVIFVIMLIALARCSA